MAILLRTTHPQEIVDAIKALVDTNNRGYVNGAIKNYKMTDNNISSGVQRYISNAIAAASFTSSQIKDWSTFDIRTIGNFGGSVAQIANAEIDNAIIDTAKIRELDASLASFTTARIASAEISTAQIQNATIKYSNITNLDAETAFIRQGVGNQVFIDNLAVTQSQIVSALVGELLLQRQDGSIYRVYIDDQGQVQTELRQILYTDIADSTITGDKIGEGTITGGNIHAGTITGGTGGQIALNTVEGGNLVMGTITAREIMSGSITANEIASNTIKAGNIDTSELFANTAFVGSLETTLISAPKADFANRLDISENSSITLANNKIALMVEDGSTSSNVILTSGMLQAVADKVNLMANDIDLRANNSITTKIQTETAGLYQRMDAAESSITTHATSINNLDGRISTAESTLTPTGITTILVNNDSFSAVSQKADKIDWVVASGSSASSVTMTDAALEAIANDIDLSANNTVRLAVGDLGGRNLLLDTAEGKTATVTSDNVTAYTDTFWYLTYYGINALQGNTSKTLSISCDWQLTIPDGVSLSDDAHIAWFHRGSKMSTSAGGVFCYPGTATSGHYSTFFKQTNNQSTGTKQGRFGIVNAPAGVVLTISNVKLETGAVPSEWTSAPEDIETAIQSNTDALENYSQNVQELSLELNKTNGVIQGAVMKDDLSAYIRYGASTDGQGTLELGQSNSNYVARVSPESGFQVIYDGTEMSSMKKNTVSASIVAPKRMIQMGNNVIKLSSDGGLIFN